MVRKIKLVVKFDQKPVHDSIIWNKNKCNSGALVEYQVGDPVELGLRRVYVD
jgi:hypothetical protein